MPEDDFEECTGCPAEKKEPPFECNVLRTIKNLVGMHSGMTPNSPKRMRIQVTKCHHKVRMLKEEQK